VVGALVLADADAGILRLGRAEAANARGLESNCRHDCSTVCDTYPTGLPECPENEHCTNTNPVSDECFSSDPTCAVLRRSYPRDTCNPNDQGEFLGPCGQEQPVDCYDRYKCTCDRDGLSTCECGPYYLGSEPYSGFRSGCE